MLTNNFFHEKVSIFSKQKVSKESGINLHSRYWFSVLIKVWLRRQAGFQKASPLNLLRYVVLTEICEENLTPLRFS